jgi:hypothetical protein
MKITVSQLRKIIREEVEKVSRPGSFAHGDSPDPDDVYEKFIELRDKNGEVPLKKLAAELGVEPSQIDWSKKTRGGMGTGLRVINGVVSELLGDTPYRTPR